MQKDNKGLSASRNGIKENITDVQQELPVLKETFTEKVFLMIRVIKSERLHQVFTVSNNLY